MTTADWGVWVGYEIVVAIAVFAKTILWFRTSLRGTGPRLESWVGMLLLAFFAALGLGWWRGPDFLAALIGFGLASAMIVSAAVNATNNAGSRETDPR